jgi:DUF4097 and DUF4098 domain-containing protein YvlB
VLLESQCHVWIGTNSCNVNYTVAVPPAFAVEVIASAGDVRASGLTGTVRLTTAAGDVHVDRMFGDLTLRTSAGDVDAFNLRSDTVEARTAAGDVMLAFADAPRTVSAQTFAGDVDVVVPAGRYQVVATTSAGDSFVDPGLQSADSTLRITASSRAGDVHVHPTTG